MSHQIQTTHVGSLPRSEAVTRIIFAREGVSIDDQPVTAESLDDARFHTAVAAATNDIVASQKKVGIDIPSDGEMSKLSYATYIKDRLTGFEGDSPRRTPADLNDFPLYKKRLSSAGGTPTYKRPQCVDKITVKTMQPLMDDITRFQDALNKSGYAKGFMNAASPGVIALFQPSIYHQTHRAYLENLAEVMQVEYEAIVDAGLDVQIDSPDLGLGRHMMFADQSEAEYLRTVCDHVEVLNHALRNIPADRIRLHICWGNYVGPHHHDIEIDKLLPLLFDAKPRNLLFESSNPRHAHEWQVWQGVDIPDDYILYPGVIDSTSNFIEHPELVKQRLQNFTRIVGADRVVASTDCGFATFAGYGLVDTDIVWQKLASLVAGAELASTV